MLDEPVAVFVDVGRYLTKLRIAFSSKKNVVVPIGSSVTGLGSTNSDLDIVLMTDHRETKQSVFNERFKKDLHFRKTQMNIVVDVLKSSKLVDVNSIQQLLSSHVKVPILKFRSCDGINVDLQFNNIPSIRSSLFVKTCVEFSIVVPIIIHWINAFFDAAKLKDSRHGLFSSYHLNMLALHFLQATPLPLLPDMISSYPHLQPTVPWHNVAERLISEISEGYVMDSTSSQHHLSSAEVILKMIDYYSQMDLLNVAIDTTGKCYQRLTEDEEHGFIQLIDPYFRDSLPHILGVMYIIAHILSSSHFVH
ncbi:hypothetical protein KIN20_016053 [Parelaphostrongylus tenuis]|uniref:Poly(A) RNA polymerase mitochondrial-like central palm domain-containing protein n=1 Tax=Parelaphostrongylus tenuis TaxID=148309 RepID=A0AAD5MKP0_PARTN|nr:hypothetical protein KIN20_016053 [Parelaphostrongylus tenuis]